MHFEPPYLFPRNVTRYRELRGFKSTEMSCLPIWELEV